MKLLLDTHVFLGFISGDTRLPITMRNAIRNTNNDVYLSVISVWEAVIKHQLGKLPLPQPPADYLPLQREKHQMTSLPLDEASVSYLARLPELHRDPFDRMLICQCLAYDLTLATVDKAILAYSIPVLAG